MLSSLHSRCHGPMNCVREGAPFKSATKGLKGLKGPPSLTYSAAAVVGDCSKLGIVVKYALMPVGLKPERKSTVQNTLTINVGRFQNVVVVVREYGLFIRVWLFWWDDYEGAAPALL
jgi:hypothetical protein